MLNIYFFVLAAVVRHTDVKTAARNPENCRSREVYGCRAIDVKQALGNDQYI